MKITLSPLCLVSAVKAAIENSGHELLNDGHGDFILVPKGHKPIADFHQRPTRSTTITNTPEAT